MLAPGVVYAKCCDSCKIVHCEHPCRNFLQNVTELLEETFDPPGDPRFSASDPRPIPVAIPVKPLANTTDPRDPRF